MTIFVLSWQEECMVRYKQLVEMVKKRKMNGEAELPSECGDEKPV
jgi:hypothetical protein